METITVSALIEVLVFSRFLIEICLLHARPDHLSSAAKGDEALLSLNKNPSWFYGQINVRPEHFCHSLGSSLQQFITTLLKRALCDGTHPFHRSNLRMTSLHFETLALKSPPIFSRTVFCN